MSNSKHTPGPWTVDTNESSFVVAKGYPVSIPGNADDIGTPAAVANARFIACAPEMYDLLLDIACTNNVFAQHAQELVRKIKGGTK